MESTGNLKDSASNLKDKVYAISRTLHSEVYGGKWNDDVGSSYIPYTQNLTAVTENFLNTAASAEQIEKQLISMNDSADKSKLSELKSAVNSL